MPPSRQSYLNKGFPLPAETNPAGRLYCCIPVPDDPTHLANFFGALSELALWSNYQRDDEKRGKPTADVWRDILTEITFSPDPCNQIPTDGCRTFSPGAPFISYAPQNPYRQPSFIPDGYLLPPFSVVSDLVGWLIPGIEAGDIALTPLSFPFNVFGQFLPGGEHYPWTLDVLDALLETIETGLPRFRLTLVGTGEVEIHLLNVPLGGMALVITDNNPLTAEIIDLNLDVTSAPFEIDPVLTVERAIDTPGEHVIDVTFLPVFDDSATNPVRFGGGIRKIVLCGFDEVSPVSDPCCPEEIELLKQLLAAQQATTNLYNLQLELMDDGTIPSFAPDAPEYFDSSSADTTPETQSAREAAMCDAIQQYAVAVLAARAQEIATDIAAEAAAAAVLAAITGGAGALFLGAFIGLRGIGAAGEIDALQDEESIRKAICCVYQNLKGQAVSFDNFKAAGSGCDLEGDAATVLNAINASLQYESNFRQFVQGLSQAMNNAVAGTESECQCCEADELDTIDWGHNSTGYYPASEAEKIAGFTYRIYSEEFILNAGGTSNARKGLAIEACGPDGFQISEWNAYASDGSPLTNPIDRSFIDINGNGTGYTVGAPGQPQLGIVTAYIFDYPPGVVPPDWYLEIVIS